MKNKIEKILEITYKIGANDYIKTGTQFSRKEAVKIGTDKLLTLFEERENAYKKDLVKWIKKQYIIHYPTEINGAKTTYSPFIKLQDIITHIEGGE